MTLPINCVSLYQGCPDVKYLRIKQSASVRYNQMFKAKERQTRGQVNQIIQKRTKSIKINREAPYVGKGGQSIVSIWNNPGYRPITKTK